MTVHTIETVQGVIDEMQGHHIEIGSVYQYVNAGNKKTMFAVFTAAQCCDIYDSPYVLEPVLIWQNGKFIGNYEYLN